MREVDDRSRVHWIEAVILPLEPWLRSRISRARWRDVDPDDIVQDCYVRLLRARWIPPVAHPQAYLFRTAQNAMLERRRRAAVVAIDYLPPFDLAGVIADQVEPDVAIDARDRLERVSSAFDTMPDRRRTIVMLRRFEGLSLRETAAQIGVTESAVEKQLRHAMARLRAAAEPGEPQALESVTA